MSELDIVVAQSPAELEGPIERLAWLEECLHRKEVRGAELLLLPELFLTGYNIGAKVIDWAEESDGPYAQKIAALCTKHNIAIHYGFAEQYQGDTYNSAICFSREGKRLGGHRKILLPPGYEGDHFCSGNSFELFEINGLKIATLICYDAEFPENFRHVAQMGAELVLVPTALSDQWGIVAHNVIPTRAFENGVLVCYANHAGSENGVEYLGSSCIVGADGKELQRAGRNSQFLRAIVSKEQVKAAQKRLPYLQDMRRLAEVIIVENEKRAKP